MNFEVQIPSDEPVRLLNAVLEELDYRKLTATYNDSGFYLFAQIFVGSIGHLPGCLSRCHQKNASG